MYKETEANTLLALRTKDIGRRSSIVLESALARSLSIPLVLKPRLFYIASNIVYLAEARYYMLKE